MSSATPDMDLGTEEGVRTYLAETEWAGAEVIPLSGGLTNFVFRLRPVVPYRGKETIVLKHAKGYVKSFQTIKVGLERQVSCLQTFGTEARRRSLIDRQLRPRFRCVLLLLVMLIGCSNFCSLCRNTKSKP